MSNQIKILQINSGNFGSTGNIMLNISKIAEKQGYISYVAYANSRSSRKKNVDNSLLIGSIFGRNLHLKLAYHTGFNGCFSKSATKIFLKKVDEIKPNIIHLHNLHNCYINLKMLFDYIKSKGIAVVWTLHDCWAFTGQCPHFAMVKCRKWKNSCFDCPQYKEYPASRVDKTKKMYALKKEWFTGIKNLTIVTPSQWLADRVKESFLKEYSIKVINNGIDLNIFKPTQSNFREKYNLIDKKILLGVANPWSKKKGIDIFIELSKKLDENYKIVLVGVTDNQVRELPQNILSIKKTNNPLELAEIYSSADIFLNPTLEDNFPTTNIEAIACGIPVITFNTGGSIEIINKYTGRIIKSNKIHELLTEISSVINEGNEKYLNERLVNSLEYNNKRKFEEYVKLYFKIFK